ncbi:MAG: hydrogenase maturation protease [Euryarchaeota archaeon]|nr:hydrogenase maturation protease [Euryarchaeota archaeon]
MKKIGIIGIGNLLRKDDGVGIVLLERLQKQKKKFPKNIEFIDGGTGGMNLLHLLAQFDTVLLIDAVDFKGRPGDARVFSLKDIQSQKKSVMMSTHDPDFLNLLRLSQELKEIPEILVIFGVQPRDVSHGMGLSKEIETVLDDLYLKLQKEIQDFVK